MKHTGIVKWFNPELGYGFIAVAPSVKLELGMPPEADLYVHASGIVGKPPKSLDPDDRVGFEVEKGRAGFRAIHVTVQRPAARPVLQYVAD